MSNCTSFIFRDICTLPEEYYGIWILIFILSYIFKGKNDAFYSSEICVIFLFADYCNLKLLINLIKQSNYNPGSILKANDIHFTVNIGPQLRDISEDGSSWLKCEHGQQSVYKQLYSNVK